MQVQYSLDNLNVLCSESTTRREMCNFRFKKYQVSPVSVLIMLIC